MDKSQCPTRDEIENAFGAKARFADKARLADHALVCPACRAKLLLLAGLKAEMDRRGPDWRILTGQAPMVKGPGRRRRAPRLFLPVAAVLMAGMTFLSALWLASSPGDRLSFRGGGPAVLELIAPDGMLREPPRVFCWTPYPGVDTYLFELVDDRLEPLVPSTGVPNHTTACIIPELIRERIRPGRTYIWRVWALDEDNLPVASEQKSFEIRPPAQPPDKTKPAQ